MRLCTTWYSLFTKAYGSSTFLLRVKTDIQALVLSTESQTFSLDEIHWRVKALSAMGDSVEFMCLRLSLRHSQEIEWHWGKNVPQERKYIWHKWGTSLQLNLSETENQIKLYLCDIVLIPNTQSAVSILQMIFLNSIIVHPSRFLGASIRRSWLNANCPWFDLRCGGLP